MGLKDSRPKAQASLEIQLLDFLYGEWGEYVKKYKKLEQEAEKRLLRTSRVSMLAAYNNVIEWRHQFAHEGKVASTASYREVTQAYHIGKEVIHCLAKAMRR